MGALFPNPPPILSEFPATQPNWSFFQRLNPGLAMRLGRPSRCLWVNPEPDRPIRLIDIVILPFASAQFAERYWRLQSPRPELLETLVNPPPRAVLIGSERLVVRWQRGPAHLTEIQARYNRVILSLMAVCIDETDVEADLAALEEQIRTKVDATPPVVGEQIPPLLWQILIGVTAGIAAGLLRRYLGGVTDTSIANVVGLGLLAFLIGYFLVYPRIYRATRFRHMWRDSLINGDRDGSVRRALLSVGVQLPPD